MPGPLDTLRSLVAEAAGAAGRRVRGVAPVANLVRRLAEARDGVATVTEAELTAALAHTPGVSTAMVLARRGALQVDLLFADGARWQARLVPGPASFAPRGAKEVAFLVEPPEAAADRHARDVVATLAGVVARALWGLWMPRQAPRGEARAVDREGDVFRVDLRSVPEVARLARAGALATALELLVLREVTCDDGALRLRLGLPAGAR